MKATHMTKLKQVLEGKSKAQAKGVTRKGIAGYGKAIIAAQESEQDSVRVKILECIKQDDATLLLAIQEVETLRDLRVKACKGERKEKKIASVRVSFARILTILRAYSKGEQRDKIKSATSLPEMYAYASRKGTKRGLSAKLFDEKQFAEWSKKITRVCGTAPGKTAKKGEREKFDDALARLESHLMLVLQTLQKHEHATYVNVKAIMALARKGGKHVRLAKAA